MARKTVAICDKCKTKFADYSIFIRESVVNLELKLTKEKAEKIKPRDLCEECLNEMLKPLETADVEKEKSQT